MCVDNEPEDTIVANILNTKYNNLYNSVPYDEVEMNHIKEKFQDIYSRTRIKCMILMLIM